MSLGKLIKKQREKLKLSQIELASRLGYDGGQVISNIERDASPLPNKLIKKLCGALDISIEDLKQEKLRIYSKKLDRLLK